MDLNLTGGEVTLEVGHIVHCIPQTELDAYSCRHGMGYSVFKGTKNKLTAELTSFVPVGETCEVGKLSLTNESDETRNFSVFSYVEFCPLESSGTLL